MSNEHEYKDEELKAAAEEAESDELSEDEAEAVAGGGIGEIVGEIKETASDVWKALT